MTVSAVLAQALAELEEARNAYLYSKPEDERRLHKELQVARARVLEIERDAGVSA